MLVQPLVILLILSLSPFLRSKSTSEFAKPQPKYQAFAMQTYLEATERLSQRDCLLHDNVVAAPLEHRVLALLEDEHNVSGFDTRLLVAFPAECDLLSIAHALVDVDLGKGNGADGIAVSALSLQVFLFQLLKCSLSTLFLVCGTGIRHKEVTNEERDSMRSVFGMG